MAPPSVAEHSDETSSNGRSGGTCMRMLLQSQPAHLLLGFANALRAAGLVLIPLLEALSVTLGWSRNLVSFFGLKIKVEKRF